MSIEGWRYYNHAAIPSCAPHETPNITSIEDGTIWKAFDKSPLLARWTTDFDCNEETGWWYVIKDTPFDITKISSKRRNLVRRGLSRFKIVQIDPNDYIDGLFEVYTEAVKTYPKTQQNFIARESFDSTVAAWSKYIVYGAFSLDDDKLAAFALITKHQSYYDFTSMKSNPIYEKQQVNAALICGMLYDIEDDLSKGIYICDGAKNINHETNFQEYLIKYFGFRKAYCRLNLFYNPKIKWIVKFAYPFRNFLKLFDKIKIVHNLLSVLQMEEIVRMQK